MLIWRKLVRCSKRLLTVCLFFAIFVLYRSVFNSNGPEGALTTASALTAVAHGVVELGEYGFTYCTIPKSMLTVGLGIMCYLADPRQFRRRYKKQFNSYQWYDVKCHWENHRGSYSDEMLARKDYSNLVVIRDPVERFVSGWLDKCIRSNQFCNDCGQNISCFIKRAYSHMRARQADPDWHDKVKTAKTVLGIRPRSGKTKSTWNDGQGLADTDDQLLSDPKNTQPLFDTLDGLVLSKGEPVQRVNKKYTAEERAEATANFEKFGGFLLGHFYPQNWFCKLARAKERFTVIEYGRSDAFYDGLLDFFGAHGVGKEQLDDINGFLHAGPSFHSTFDSQIRQVAQSTIRNSSELRDILYKMFYHDYRLFHMEPRF